MSDVKSSHLTCIDLFSGAGGFSFSAAEAGFLVRIAIESDIHAARTLSDNIRLFQAEPCMVLNCDITKLNPEKLASQAFGPENMCDLVLGGPPCQGFSTHRIKNAGVGDERNSLIHTYFEYVKAFKPKAFLLENVPGMLWSRHRDYVEEFYRTGTASGYHLEDPIVLDARDYGVPQRRKRVFILGVSKEYSRENLVWPPEPTYCSPASQKKRSSLACWRNCRSAFLPSYEGDPNDVHMNHSAELVEAFRNTPHNGGSRRDSGRVLPCHKTHDGHKDVYGRIDPDLPAPTMTTACINPSKGRFVHPTEDHGITVRQAARIQTFPDSIVFSGGLMAAGKQIGNAIPMQLGISLLSHLKSFLSSCQKHSDAESQGRFAAE